jgi:uncharacterized membrane protein HdeD (DUF308 family)
MNPERKDQPMSVASSLLWRGIVAIAIGVVSVAWPNITVGAIVILFAVFAFLVAITDAMRAFSSASAGPVVGYLLLAVISVAAGVVALFWPDITALVLTLWVAAWAMVTGIIDVAMAFRRGEAAGERSLWALGGLLSIALGVVLFVRPDIGALALATVFGLFSIVYGVSALILSFQARHLGTTAQRLSSSHV